MTDDFLIEQFLQEREYLLNVSPKTLELYKYSFKAFAGAMDDIEQVKARIIELRSAGMTPVTINTYVRHVKSFFIWQNKPWKLRPLKEEQKLLSTLTMTQVRDIESYKPVGTNETRARAVALTILDTGLRASEVLELLKEDVDLDNMVLKVVGKGQKHRQVPFSNELRKTLYLHLRNQTSGVAKVYVFGTKNNTPVSVRNFERDLKILGKKVGITGIRFSPHTLRHTFAVIYLRKGGNLEYLRRILGHSSILTTQRYLRSLGITDLGDVHGSYSPLGK